jgi:integrase
MASIKKYTDKHGVEKYEFRFYAGLNEQTGKQRYIHKQGFKTKKSATLALSRLQLELDQNGTIEKPNNILFSEVYQEWVEQYVNTVRESTYAKVLGIFNNHILPAFGNKRIRTITARQVQHTLNQWFDLTKINYKRWLSYTSSIFDFAMRYGYTKNNPTKLVSMPKHEDSSGDVFENYWTKDELVLFFSHLDLDKRPQKFALFRVLAFCGLRCGECLALTWNDLTLSDNTLRINKTLATGLHGNVKIQAPKTKASRRTIDLDPLTVTALKKWRIVQRKLLLGSGVNAMSKDQLIFTNQHNQLMNPIVPAQWLKRIIKQYDLKRITVHGFRHSHASALFAAGASIKEVQSRLGHTDVKTTLDIYTHVSKEQDRATVKKLVNYLDF